MTQQRSLLPQQILNPLVYLLAAALLFGCALTDSLAGLLPGGGEEMSLEQALAVEPDDARPTVLEEMGPPDAFTIEFQELEGQIVRWETWSYFDFSSQFDFIDGELLWTVDLEEIEDGSIFAHWYDPLAFQAGMSQAEVRGLLSDQELLEVDLDALDLEGGLILAGDQIMLGFQDDQLFYVETVILSPDPAGEPLAGLPSQAAAGEPTAQPAAESTLTAIPTTAPTPDQDEDTDDEGTLTFLRDDFDASTPAAVPSASQDFMDWEHIDGQGRLTSKTEGGILIAFYESPLFRDFILEVDIDAGDFSTGSKAGVIFRGEDPTDTLHYYYYVAVAPQEESLVLGVFQDIEWKLWEYTDIPPNMIPADGIYHLKIDCQGDRISVFLDNELIVSQQDSWIPQEGVIGLTLAAYEIPEPVYFDNLLVIEHP